MLMEIRVLILRLLVWQQVKSWIEEYIKPLVPAAQLSAELARIMEIIRNMLGGRG